MKREGLILTYYTNYVETTVIAKHEDFPGITSDKHKCKSRKIAELNAISDLEVKIGEKLR